MERNLIIVILGLIASIITIFVFVSGIRSCSEMDIQTSENPITSTTKISESDSKQLGRKIEVKYGLLGSKVVCISDEGELLIHEGIFSKVYLSPDSSRVIIIYNSGLCIVNVDGSDKLKYDINSGSGTKLKNRDIENGQFVDNETFQFQISLYRGSKPFLGVHQLSGTGVYRVRFDKRNNIISMNKIR